MHIWNKKNAALGVPPALASKKTPIRMTPLSGFTRKYRWRRMWPARRRRSQGFQNIAAVLLILATSVSCTAISRIAGLGRPEASIPTVKVVREPVEVKVYTIGELRPTQTAMIVAPPVAGGTLQIIHIVKTGTYVKQGDVIVDFDPSEQEYNLEQSQSQLDEADQQIRKMKADQSVRVAQENVSLLTAQYAVRRAELKVKGNDLLGKIEARKNVIELEESRRRLEQLQQDIKSRASSDAADLMVQNVAHAKAALGIKMAQQFIDNMTIRAPISGIISLGQNFESLMSAGGSIIFSSVMEIPTYRDGDQASPGRVIGQVQGVEQMEIASRVIETDRGNLEPGQSADVLVDSKPLKTFQGKIKSLAGSTSSESSMVNYLENMSTRSFAAVFEVDAHDDPLNLGVTARVTIKGRNVKDALSIPRQALQQKEGKQVVYVRCAKGWEAREIRIQYLTESRAVIEGLAEGTEVALVNPEQQKSRNTAKPGAPAPALGGTI
jgi:HlyD family secretion protein